MTAGPSTVQRLIRLLQRLPESAANSVRFRVPFLLPRWFKPPAQLRVAGKVISPRYINGEDSSADFIDCILVNAYGLGQKLGEVRSVIDVGANLGFFALAARDFYPEATIHAYEPNPRVLPYLRANTSEFDVSIFAEAVGAEDGFVKILDEGPSGEARTRSSGPDGAVRQVSIATAIQRMGGAVDLLKLDCEGAEWELLADTRGLNGVRHIRMEYHLSKGRRYEQALDLLGGAGFHVVHAGPQNGENGIIWASR
jgi:FkbM family methyltransferase